MKKILTVIFIFVFLSGACAPEEVEVLNYSDKEMFQIEIDCPASVRQGEAFSVVVKSKNLTNKRIKSKTNSTYYGRGVNISIFLTEGDKNVFLFDGILENTADIRTEIFWPHETIEYIWRFDGSVAPADSARYYDRETAPKGIYTLKAINGQEFKEILKIV